MENIDAECNALFRKLESMKGTPKDGGPEYMETLYALRDATQNRNARIGLKVSHAQL